MTSKRLNLFELEGMVAGIVSLKGFRTQVTKCWLCFNIEGHHYFNLLVSWRLGQFRLPSRVTALPNASILVDNATISSQISIIVTVSAKKIPPGPDLIKNIFAVF